MRPPALCANPSSEHKGNNHGRARAQKPKFAPAGQSTQMIVGADAADDGAILNRAAGLYSGYKLRRVYYSAFSPIPDASSRLPLRPPPEQLSLF